MRISAGYKFFTRAWLRVTRGSLHVNGTTLKIGNAVVTSRTDELDIDANETTNAFLFDLA